MRLKVGREARNEVEGRSGRRANRAVARWSRCRRLCRRRETHWQGAHAGRVKVMVNLWPVAFAIRCRVVVEGMLPAFSSRVILPCTVLSFAASSVCERPAAVRTARIAAPS
jgi:hypothetical protein